MTLAWISLIALALVIALSCTNRVHPGFLALALAWIIAVFVSPWFEQTFDFKKDVLTGFPADLFLTLTGVSLLFTQAHLNGTLDRLAHASVRLCRGNVGLIPWMFFLLSAGFSMLGAGNIATAALIAPTAMTIAHKAKISAVLMTLLVAHGSLAGALSTVAPTGIVAKNKVEEIGLPDHGMDFFIHNLAANIVVAVAAFLIFGGFGLFSRRYVPGASPEDGSANENDNDKFQPVHWFTLALIGALMAGALIWKIDVGMGGFVCAVILALTGLAPDGPAVKQMPWSVIVMVCGINVLTSLLEKTGGNDLFADLVVRISSPQSAPATMGFVAAIISVYSSTLGVVLPVFLPMVKDVVAKMPESDSLALALSVVVAGHLVDSSPLSTIGALCVAGARTDSEKERQRLFSTVLFWGLSMAVVGAVWCYVFYGLLW